MKKLFSKPVATPVEKPVNVPDTTCCKITCCK